MSQSITRFMAFDHKRCDDLYAEGESKVLEGQLEEGMAILGSFIVGMERHFKIEETILFPTFEETTGMTQGPTQVMRMEHEQMKSILHQMQNAITSQSGEEITGLGETLLVLMQQHNMKEEQMLYFMMEQHLGHLAEKLIISAKKIDF
ncbi:MAG: hemerythrin domain-containing protein [Proteobacteria bacterium]|nr:hemerythrin domain-containing protein [Pseudomonadota bacterium]